MSPLHLTDLLAIVIASLAFILTTWQVLRTEGLTPHERWEMLYDSIDDNVPNGARARARIRFRPVRDFGAFNVVATGWGSARIEEFNATEVPQEGPFTITVSWTKGDADAFAGLTYFTPSRVRRRRVAGAVRWSATPIEEDGVDRDGKPIRQYTYLGFQWRFHWWWFFLTKDSSRNGRWKEINAAEGRRSALPCRVTPDSESPFRILPRD